MRRNGRCEKCPAPTLLPECEQAVRAYLVCNTQWRVGANGRTGLDYPACQAAIETQRERLQLPPWPEVFADLQIIEHTMLAADAEHREKNRQQRVAERGK